MNKKFRITALALGLLPCALFAHESQYLYYQLGYSLLGAPKAQQSQTITSTSGPTSTSYYEKFTGKGAANVNFTVGGGYHMQPLFWSHLFSSNDIGASVSYNLPYEIKGERMEYDADTGGKLLDQPYNYKYKLSNLMLMANYTFNFKAFAEHYVPYFTVGLGLDNYHFSNYSESYDGSSAAVLDQVTYADKNSWNLAYSADVGIHYSYKHNYLLSLGYHFVHAGTATSSNGTGIDTGATPGSVSIPQLKNTLNLNEIYLRFTYYLFGKE